jgi:hypothetical protein
MSDFAGGPSLYHIVKAEGLSPKAYNYHLSKLCTVHAHGASSAYRNWNRARTVAKMGLSTY